MFKFCCTSFSLSLSDPFKFFCCSIACCPLHTSPHAGLTESPKCDLNFSVLTPEHPYSHNFQSLKLCSAESLFLFGWSALDHTVDGFRSLSPCLECVHAYMYVSTCTWRSEADIGCLSWLFLHIIIIIVIDYMFFFFWDKISYWTLSSSICPDWLASKPLFHSPHLCADVTGAAGSKDGTQVFMLAQQTLYQLSCPCQPCAQVLSCVMIFCSNPALYVST